MTNTNDKIDDLMNIAFSYDAPSMPDFTKVGEISEDQKDGILELIDEDLDNIVAAGCKDFAEKFIRDLRNNKA